MGTGIIAWTTLELFLRLSRKPERNNDMDHFRTRYYNDVRNGWPFDYHRSFWSNYYYNYWQPQGSYQSEWDYGPFWPYYGPRDESYYWNHESLHTPDCPPCFRASIETYRDYPRKARRHLSHCMSLTRRLGDYCY